MAKQTKLIFGMLLAPLLLVSCSIPSRPDGSPSDVYTKTKTIQESLSQAGFKVGKVDSGDIYACDAKDGHEGEFQEFSFEIFVPFSNQNSVAGFTEMAMAQLDIERVSSPDSPLVAVAGKSGNETYSLFFSAKDSAPFVGSSALFVASTPCNY